MSCHLRKCDFISWDFLTYISSLKYNPFKGRSRFDSDFISMHNNLEPALEFASDHDLHWAPFVYAIKARE